MRLPPRPELHECKMTNRPTSSRPPREKEVAEGSGMPVDHFRTHFRLAGDSQNCLSYPLQTDTNLPRSMNLSVCSLGTGLGVSAQIRPNSGHFHAEPRPTCDMLAFSGKLMTAIQLGSTLPFDFIDLDCDPTRDPDYDLAAADSKICRRPNLSGLLLQKRPADSDIRREVIAQKERGARRWILVGHNLHIKPDSGRGLIVVLGYPVINSTQLRYVRARLPVPWFSLP
jgi:hypothetical protein